MVVYSVSQAGIIAKLIVGIFSYNIFAEVAPKITAHPRVKSHIVGNIFQ